MKFSLFPKSYKFYDLFILQIEQILKAITTLNNMFNNEGEMQRSCKEILLIEAEGNNISRDIAKQLSLTFITPIDREDIHDLNVAQEALLNVLKGICNRISLLTHTNFTPESKELICNLKFMIEEINNILQLFLKKKDPGENVRRVQTLKELSDAILLRALTEVYRTDLNQQDAIVEIITWSQIYDRIEKSVIRAENLANIWEGISLKYA
jgi:uncharacterized protein Yka (UPF0111/DUF47 family)